MTSRTPLLSLFAAACLTQTGCGGGGGGDAAPTPAAALPPSIAAGKLSIARVTTGCAPTLSCLPFTHASIDDNGETTVLWAQADAGSSELHAANYAGGATTPLSAGVIDQGFVTATNAPRFAARALASRRLLLLQRDSAPAGSPPPAPGVPDAIHARVIDLQAGGTPLTGASSLLPASLAPVGVLPSLVQDGAGTLYGFSAASPLPASPVDLGRGQSLTLVAAPAASFDSVAEASIADFPQSIDPRALWVVSGRQSAATTGRQVYLAQTSLTSGQVLPPSQVSTQPVVTGSSQVGCVDDAGVRARAAGTSALIVSWRQLNAGGTGCDLVVNGTQVNTGSRNVTDYAVNGTDAGLVAVWTERDSLAAGHTMWSTRRVTDTAWSAPARLAPQYIADNVDASIQLQAVGPAGTLAVLVQVATPIPGTNSANVDMLLARYADGSWNTVSTPYSARPRALVINRRGQGALLTGDYGDCGSAACQELAAFRF